RRPFFAENPIGWHLHNRCQSHLSRSGARGHFHVHTLAEWAPAGAKLQSEALQRISPRGVCLVAALSALIVLLPILLVGVSGFATLTREWWISILWIVTDAGDTSSHMSLRRSIGALLESDIGSPVYCTCRGMQAFWLTALVGYFAALARPAAPERDHMRLADICVLMMALLPLSTRFDRVMR